MSHNIDLLDTQKYAPKKSRLATRRDGSLRRASQRGMVTAEYAVGILVAVGLAIVMLNILKSSEVGKALLGIVQSILKLISALIK